MRHKWSAVFGCAAYLVAVACFLINKADIPIGKMVLVGLWFLWLCFVAACLLCAESPVWRAAWVLFSIALMFTTTELVFLIFFWAIGGFAP